jgi:hypothetical protein
VASGGYLIRWFGYVIRWYRHLPLWWRALRCHHVWQLVQPIGGGEGCLLRAMYSDDWEYRYVCVAGCTSVRVAHIPHQVVIAARKLAV